VGLTVSSRREKIPQTVFGRTSRLLFSGAKIAAREVAGRLSNDDSKLANKIRQTEELVATLGQLKGAAMKAGQLISLEFSDLLPPEVLAILRQLHDSSTFMPYEQVRFILQRELGKDKVSQLEDFSPEPIAAASIGQVHRATLKGQPVAVKVQYPGVSKSIDSDLAMVRRVVSLGLQIQGKSVDITPVFDEISAGLKKEADYRLEADNVDLYRKTLTNPAYIVPSVFREYSSEHVLTLSFEEGMRISDWIKSQPDKAAVQRFADLIITLVIDEFLRNGVMQTDPNFGNFLYRPAQGHLVLLDFGATNVYSAEYRRTIREILTTVVSGDFHKMVEMTHSYGLLSREESAETLAHFRGLIEKMAQIFHPAQQPFRFLNEQWLREVRDLTGKFLFSVKYTLPPEQLMFLNRKLAGMFHLLKDLDAQVEMGRYLDYCLKMPID
jgi:aarF domain-containing kinase